MFRSVSANGSSRSEIVRHTWLDKESEGTHEAIFRAGSHLHRPLARCGKVRAQRRDGVRRFDIGLILCGTHRPLKRGSSCGIDIEASVLPNTVGQSERKPYVIDPLLFLNAPFVEGAFKLRIQARVAHAGAEEPPLTQLLAHRKAHRHGTLVAFRLIEILQVLRRVDVVEQKTVQLRLFKRVQQRTVGHEIVRKLLQRMDFASHPSVGMICEREIIELDGRIGRSCGRSSTEIHSPRIVLASNRGGDMNIHCQLSIGDWGDDSRQRNGVAALRQIGKRSGERGKSETICDEWRGRLRLHR